MWVTHPSESRFWSQSSILKHSIFYLIIHFIVTLFFFKLSKLFNVFLNIFTDNNFQTTRCMDCREIFDIKAVYKYGKNWKCKPCHSSWRWCRDNDPSWGSYNAEQKRLTVVANRKASARGTARKLIAQHKA